MRGNDNAGRMSGTASGNVVKEIFCNMSEFKFQPIFDLGEDTTEYRSLGK